MSTLAPTARRGRAMPEMDATRAAPPNVVLVRDGAERRLVAFVPAPHVAERLRRAGFTTRRADVLASPPRRRA